VSYFLLEGGREREEREREGREGGRGRTASVRKNDEMKKISLNPNCIHTRHLLIFHAQ
jgi:hypothetical protein